MKIIVPFLLSCGEDISAHVELFEVENLDEIKDEFATRMWEGDNDEIPIFYDDHEIYDETDYILVNLTGIIEI